MSTQKRPWYKWYPKDFNQDEKVRCLPALAELVYRRALDLMWQSNSIRIPNAMRLLYESLGKGMSEDDFSDAWDRIQHPNFELFRVSDDKKWVYSARLLKEKEAIEQLVNKRSSAGNKGAVARWEKSAKQTHGKRIANAKQTHSKPMASGCHTDTDTDIDIKKKIYKRKISENFILTNKLKNYAIERNIPEKDIKDMFDHFKNHHIAKGTVMIDWERAWYTWVINSKNFNQKFSIVQDNPYEIYKEG